MGVITNISTQVATSRQSRRLSDSSQDQDSGCFSPSLGSRSDSEISQSSLEAMSSSDTTPSCPRSEPGLESEDLVPGQKVSVYARYGLMVLQRQVELDCDNCGKATRAAVGNDEWVVVDIEKKFC